MAGKKEAANKAKIDPFKTRKVQEADTRTNDTITPPADVAAAIDQFRECQEQSKHFDGEATIHKDLVVKFAQQEYARRVTNGIDSSFKILGNDTMVTFIATSSSAGLTEDDAAGLAERWGEKAAEELVVRDYASIRFDADVLEANYQKVVDALQALPEEVLQKLFKPMLMKASPHAIERAKKFAKNPDELHELLQQLKIKNYIK